MVLANNIEQVKKCDLQAVLSLQKTAFMEVAKQMNNYDIPPLLQDIQDVHNDFDTCVIPKYISSCLKFSLFTREDTPNTSHLYTKVGYHVVYKKEIDGINLIHMEKDNNYGQD